MTWRRKCGTSASNRKSGAENTRWGEESSSDCSEDCCFSTAAPCPKKELVLKLACLVSCAAVEESTRTAVVLRENRGGGALICCMPWLFDHWPTPLLKGGLYSISRIPFETEGVGGGAKMLRSSSSPVVEIYLRHVRVWCMGYRRQK